MRYRQSAIATIAILLTLFVATASPRQEAPFPNELPRLHLWTGSFAKLVFFTTTKSDAAAIFPKALDQGDGLLVILPDWEVTLDFPGARLGAAAANVPEDVAGKLVSVRFRATTRIHLDPASFGKDFTRDKVDDEDSPKSWIVYANDRGIVYYLYASDEGGMKAGDVDYVEYWPSEEELTKHGL